MQRAIAARFNATKVSHTMRNLLGNFLRWIGRNLLSLAVIVGILLAIEWILDEREQLGGYEQKLHTLRETENAIKRFRETALKTLDSLAPRPDSALDQVEKRLKVLETTLARKQGQRKDLWESSPIERTLPITKTYRELIELDIEIALTQQAVDYSRRLRDFLIGPVEAKARIDALSQKVEGLRLAIGQSKRDQWLLSKQFPLRWQIPLTDAYGRMKALEHDQALLEKEKTEVEVNLSTQRRLLDQLGTRASMPQLSVDLMALETLIQPLGAEIAKLQKGLDGSVFRQVLSPVMKTLPTALLILVAALLSPLLVKLVAYYVVAPLAVRRPGIRLLPGGSGLISIGDGPSGKDGGRPPASSVALSLLLEEKTQLLISPRYLQAVSLDARKDTKWLLDWSAPLTSLAAGMYGLIRIAADGRERITISSSDDPLVEFAIMNLPAGSAVVLQPRCLVGIVEGADSRVRITRHWQLGNLRAWLTLQLRYVVFHGPSRLIVKGCRGVRVEPVTAGRAVNQAATLGFSANLSYSVARSETFPAYLFSQRDLFNDSWNGERGCCIYAETPHPKARAGLFGRGIEGVLDTFMKAFGL